MTTYNDTNRKPRTIDLYGCAPDDPHLVLWKRAMQVLPVDTFEQVGRWIVSGHYVIDYKGKAVVIHCGNLSSQMVSVQFMFGDLDPYSAARGTIEPMLLGKVVVSKEQQAAVFERKPLSDTFNTRRRLR